MTVAAKADDRSVGVEGVIVLIVGLSLIVVGGKQLPDEGDGPDR